MFVHLVAIGLAVNAHSYIRLTMDIDLVIALDAEKISRQKRLELVSAD